MANRPSLLTEAQELLMDVQIKAESGQHDDVRELVRQAASIIERVDKDMMDVIHRLKYGKERRQW
jgi:hypothetical protein